MAMAVITVDAQEAVGGESRGNASIAAGIVVAGFDADALAEDPGAELGEVGSSGVDVRGETANYSVEGDENGGGTRLMLRGQEIGIQKVKLYRYE